MITRYGLVYLLVMLVGALAAVCPVAKAAPKPASKPAPQSDPKEDMARFSERTKDSIKVLNDNWRNPNTGLWDNKWWPSANCLTALGDQQEISPDNKPQTKKLFEETFEKAKMNKVAGGRKGNWLNEYYDDQGWWALAWIKGYDVFRDKKYLKAAAEIFDDMMKNPGTPCGGMRWSKLPELRIAFIANSLHMNVAASLANRMPAKKNLYAKEAQKQLGWFEKLGAFNSSGNRTMLDSLNPKTCKPGGFVWTYNVGSMTGALVEMYRMDRNRVHLRDAITMSRGIVTHTTKDGILTEHGHPRKNSMWPDKVQGNFAMFKGPFVRSVGYLQRTAPRKEFDDFLRKNADYMWEHDRQPDGELGANWQGPVWHVSVGAQCAGIDLLNAAARSAKRKLTDTKIKATKLTDTEQTEAKRKAARRKAEQRKAARHKAEQRKAARHKAEQRKAAKRKAEQRKAAKRKAEQRKAAKRKAEQRKAAKRKAAKAAQRKAAKRKAAQRKAAKRKAAQRKYAKRKQALRL